MVTTPGQSQKLLKTSETVNLTEFYPKVLHTNKSQDVMMMGIGLNSGFLVSFASGAVEMELLDETTIK